MRRWIIIPLILAGCLGNAAAKTVTVGIVADGAAPAYETLQSRVLEELAALVKGEFVLQLPGAKRYDGAWDAATVAAALQRLEKDPNVDIVLALGVVSGAVAASQPTLARPTFAPILVRTGASAGVGSGRANLNFLDTGITFGEALERFKKAVAFTDLALILDAAHAAVLEREGAGLSQLAAVQGVRLHLVTDDGSGAALAERIPASCDAVMIALLPRLSEASAKALIEGLKARKLPSYSFDDRLTPAAGILMGNRSPDDAARRARRMALNIYGVLRGAKAESQPVHFELKAPLTINMETARAIGFSPSFELTGSALLLHEAVPEGTPRLTLAQAAREALRANLSVIAATLGSAAGNADVAEIRSLLLPQISAGLAHTRYNADNVYVESGFYAETTSAGFLRLEQLLFSDRTLARIEMARKYQTAREAQQHLLELDVVKRAATAFLELLNARERLQIRKEQLGLVRANHELAQGRVDSGVSDPSDLYYWESMIASERGQVLAAEAEVRSRSDLLNFILGRDVSAAIDPVPVTLEEPELLISRTGVRGLVTDEASLQRLESFFTDEALAHAPELAALEAEAAAETRLLASNRRAYWSPEVAAYGEATHVFDERRVPASTFSLEDETNWEVGIALKLPLYEGGARGDRIDRSRLRLEQLRTQCREARAELRRRVRADLHAMRASHPAMELARQAEEAARKSFELIRENYALGTRPMTDLLVAQNARLNARQAAADARTRFLGDLIALQRDIGIFDFFLDDDAKEAMIERLKRHAGGFAEQTTTPGVRP